MLKVSQENSRHKRELVWILYKLNIVVENLINAWAVKVNAVRSREEYLKYVSPRRNTGRNI